MGFLDYSGLSHFLDKLKTVFVAGPSSSVNNRVAIFDGTDGKKVKDSGFTIGKSVPSNAIFTDTTYTFDGTYNASSNKAATVSTVTNAINALDGGTIGTPGAGKTVTALSQTNGNIAATFGNISITKSQVSDFPTSMTPTSHTHGNIQNGGALQTNDITIASGDKLVVTDSSDSNKVARTSISFDGSTATQALTKKGTWASFTNNAGTVTKVSTGAGLTGGDVTSTGTIKANLTSETKLTNASADGTETSGRVYPVRLDKNGKLAVNVPWTNTNSSYAPKASPELTGTPTAPTADPGTNTTQIATTAFVMNSFQANDAMVFKGTIGTDGTVTDLPDTHYQGWTYKVITAGTYAGKVCEIGDMIICVTDGTTATDADWTVVQSNIDGAVRGPASSTNNHVAVFSGTNGKVIKDSGFTIGKSVPSTAEFTDTKNTAGSQNVSAQLYIIGAQSQSNDAPTYSNSTAYIDSYGYLYSRGVKVLTSHQDISGKVDKETGKGLSTNDYTTAEKNKLAGIAAGATANTGTITGIKMNGVSKGTSGVVDLGTIITSHQDISGKKNTQSAVSDPTASGTSLTFIDSISQDAQGVITPTKKTVTDMTKATSSAAGTHGLVPAPAAGKQSSFLRGDATWVVPTNTKNTAGATDSASKLFLVGATVQTDNPQTYTQDTAYVDTDGCLYSNSTKVLTEAESIIKVELSNLSSFTHDYTVTGLTANHELIRYILSYPNCQGGDLTITTGSNSLTVSGTFIGTTTTNMTLYFGVPISKTATVV